MKANRLYTRASSTLLFVAIIVLMGCAPLTPLPTRTPTPTQKICPSVTIETPGFLENQPILIISLVEQEIVFSDWTETSRAFQILSEVIPSIAKPEDRLVTFYLGPRVYDDAFISDELIGSVGLVRPSIPSTPTPYPTITSTSTPATPTPDDRIVQISTERAAEATQTHVIATTTQNAFLDQCAKLIWATSYALVATQWAQTQESAIETLRAEMQVTKTPGVSGEYFQNEVYDGFSHATRKFSEYGCIKQSGTDQTATPVNAPYSRCVLLVFSNMDEWRTPEFIRESMPILNSRINLNGIEVFISMLNCNDMSENYCLTQKNFWTEQLKNYGATSVDFFSNKDIEFHLTTFLARR